MITVNFEEGKALYLQLYDYIKEDIIHNRMAKDSKLPSKRDLAHHLGISVNTVSSAYDVLLDEGYLYAVERVGYFVSPIECLHKTPRQEKAEAKLSAPRYRYDFDLNKNGIFDFPDVPFQRAMMDSMMEDSEMNAWDKEGIPSLRRAVCHYLRASRGIDASPENVILSAGMEYLFRILFFILPKDYRYFLENPGYIDTKKIFEPTGRSPGFVTIDEGGIDPEKLSGRRGVYLVSPTHQFPTGSILRVDRRVKLLNFAKATDSYIIEDDYDSEYKYYGRLIPALKSLDTTDRVIYMSNFSKSLSPGLRVSFMVLPDELMEMYRKKDPLVACPIPNMVQRALSKYMERGYFERRLNRERKQYDKKRKAALRFFEGDPLFEIDDKRAGLHFILTCKIPVEEKELLEYLRKRDMNIYGLSDFFEGEYNAPYPKLIVGFGNMAPEVMEEGFTALVRALKELAETKEH
ncbi:transcriptional regulator, GntR family [Aedoeadaptatus coxii]|uniref:MocR-like pyridoxine biosynthesis transcription factor PdxR n=1 Tax=Aedoeadaptatus coxii TaxID=755172 RepID=UPI00176FF5AF|nr:PLP-dependent aminotransferase family protein [Peptoniphilus coxii]CAC9932308.1 transcriptional regulator, GntR family [Peptoniphilus coxii]